MQPTTDIPRNQWYVAAYSREIGAGLFARTICGEPIVFYRRQAGSPTGVAGSGSTGVAGTGPVVALADRCVHRRFPLSLGSLVDDQVVCGYHGFTYDCSGTCVAVPGQQRVPPKARVAAYPVVERDTFVWVWIGDPDRADATAVPRAPWLAADGWTAVSGMEPLAARHALLLDNLMDLSHETYLHGGYIGTPEVAQTPIEWEVEDDPDGGAGVVRVSRHMADAACPPFYARSTGLSGRITRWQDIEFHPPCLYLLHSRVAPVGVGPRPDGTDPDARHLEIVYALTPETAHSTHDFWAVARDFALDDVSVSDFLAENNRAVVRQDVACLDILEDVMRTETDGGQELSIKIDSGGLAARRLMRRLVDAPTSMP